MAKQEQNQNQRQSKGREPGVPAEDMKFAEGDDDSVSTKVGGVGWPEAAENDPDIGPSGEKLDKQGNPQSQKQTQQPEQQPQPPQPEQQPQGQTPPASNP